MRYKITSYFGSQESFRDRPHTGIDFAMPDGTQLKSINSGIIDRVVDYGNANIGKGVFVRWEDGKTAIYGHMSKIVVKEGQTIKVGDLLGYSGNTGNSTGSHLHFGLKEGGQFIDPSPYISNIQTINDANIHSFTNMNFTDFFQEHMNTLNDFIKEMSVNLIHFCSNDLLSNYFPLIQGLKNIIQIFFFNA